MPNQISIEYSQNLPDILQIAKNALEEKARMAMAVKLFEIKRLSSGMAATLAGIDRTKFLLVSLLSYAKACRTGLALSIFAFLFGVFNAAQRSLRLCRFSQKSGVFSNTFPSSKAVSTVTERLPLQISLTVFRLTPIAFASCSWVI